MRIRSLCEAPWCERHLSGFLVLWAILLQGEHFCKLSTSSFYRAIESYAPGWAWGIVMGVIGIGRYYAFFRDHPRLRLALSGATVMLLWAIAALALYERLLGAAFPLAAFAAVLATSCHQRTLQSINGMAKSPPRV